MRWDQQIFVAELNIEHFRLKLSGDLDDAQRRTIVNLLAEEEAKLRLLQSAAAELTLSELIDLLALRAKDLFNGGAFDRQTQVCDAFADTLSRVPVGMGLVDTTGEILLANEQMQPFVPRRIPSRDADGMRRYQALDGPLSPFHWPGARALRGDRVNPGIAFIFTGDDGSQVEVRVAAVPVPGSDVKIAGALAAVYDLAWLTQAAAIRALTVLLAEEESRQSNGRAVGHHID